MTTIKTVTSSPDPATQQVTALDIIQDDAGGLTLSIKLGKSNQPPVEIARADITDLFAIRFTKHNLLGTGSIPNFAYWGFLEYAPSAGLTHVIPDLVEDPTTHFFSLSYKGVGYRLDTTKVDITGVPINPLPAYVTDLSGSGFGTIDVTVSIVPPSWTVNYGWINFYLDHSYPSAFPDDGTQAALQEGWEERIIFPACKFTAPDTSTLIPLGYDESDPADTRTKRPLLQLGYGAVYKTYPGGNAPDRAQGVAVHADDDRGHYRESYYDKSNSELSFHLVNPIHLKQTAVGKAYVKPPSYSMTGGDNYGFGGNLMRYRLCAFEIAALRPQVPVDWRDVLNIYRRWIKRRQPLFYRKYGTRGTNGPLDSMATHTLIANFSIDGPVDRNPNAILAQWLEQHPAKDGSPNVLDNPNESLLSLLSRLRSRFNIWREWDNLGGSLQNSPAVSSWGPNRLDCFVRGSADGQLYHQKFDGAWRDPEPLGGGLTSGPAAVSWGKNHIDVFARGNDGKSLHHIAFDNGKWGLWENLYGNLTTGPTVSTLGPGTLDVFALDDKSQLAHLKYRNGWKPWESLGGALTSAPAAVSCDGNRIDVFARQAHGIIYQITFNGTSWSGWNSLGTPSDTVLAGSAPAVSSWGPNRLDLFVRGTDNALWHKIFDGAWGSWQRIGGSFDNAPAVVSMQPERLDCFVRLLDNTLSHTWSDLSTPADALGPNRPVLLEAQLWNCEMAGFYRFYGGFPPLADVLSIPGRFKSAMDELTSHGIVPYFTSDPLNCILNRKRFRGHLLADGAGGWKQAITEPFPVAMRARTCAVTHADITRNNVTQKNVDRVWLVHKEPNVTLNPEPQAVASCGDLALALGSMKVDSLGRSGVFAPNALGNGFYRSLGTAMCPTPPIEHIYLDNWLQNGLLANGGRLIEFMKHDFHAGSFCYNKNHQHLLRRDPTDPNYQPDAADPDDPTSFPYTTVIGRGFWYIRRCRNILRGLQQRGLANYPSFALTNETGATESMLPYVDEHYSVDAYTHFVYSNLITAKIGAFTDFTLPPGYQEKRKSPLHLRVRPDGMLSPARDDEPQPADNDAAQDASFANWLGLCTTYFNNNFFISEPGLSAQNYDTTTPDPTKVPAKYSFCRGVQDTFNLRARIFEIGSKVVTGMRIIVPSVYMEEPYDYNEEVVNFSARAAQLLFTHRDFFRTGFIVGETPFVMTIPNNPAPLPPTVWAWGSYYIFNARPFSDVQKLVDDITREDAYLGQEYRGLLQSKLVNLPNSRSTVNTFRLFDYIAQAVDRRVYYYKDSQNHVVELARNKVDVYNRVPHLIWQIGDPDAQKVLYLFANITNTPTQVEFHYDKGLATPAGTSWSKTIRWVSSDGNSQVGGSVRFGDLERQVIPARSFMSVELKR